MVLTAISLEVYDARRSKSIEKTYFDGLSLVSPTLSATVNGAIPYAESIGNVAHSMRVYKGKIFLLVSSSIVSCVASHLNIHPCS